MPFSIFGVMLQIKYNSSKCLFLLLLILSSCVKNECPDWYEGNNCTTEEREKYLGNYVGTFTVYDNDDAIISEETSSLEVFKSIDIDNMETTNFRLELISSGSPLFSVISTTGSNLFGDGAFNGISIFYNINYNDTVRATFYGTR